MTRLTSAAAPTARSKSDVEIPVDGAAPAVPLPELEVDVEAVTELPDDDVDVAPEEEVEVWEVVVVKGGPEASEACRLDGSTESDAFPR